MKPKGENYSTWRKVCPSVTLSTTNYTEKNIISAPLTTNLLLYSYTKRIKGQARVFNINSWNLW